MSYWLDKVLGANHDTESIGKIVPIIIFFVIWLVSAIAKASQKGKKGDEGKSAEGQEKHQPDFDELAKKIRERYAEAKEQARRAAEEEENGRLEPPARAPRPNAAAIPYRASPAQSVAGPKQPMFEVTKAAGQPQIKKPAAPPMQYQEGSTLKVVDGLEWTNVGTPITVEKPTLQKVEPDLHKVDAITSENAKVSAEVEVIHHQYLSELAEQYASQDGFRKAILNYEILGPPLALRD
jgi:hypothetical protein